MKKANHVAAASKSGNRFSPKEYFAHMYHMFFKQNANSELVEYLVDLLYDPNKNNDPFPVSHIKLVELKILSVEDPKYTVQSMIQQYNLKENTDYKVKHQPSSTNSKQSGRQEIIYYMTPQIMRKICHEFHTTNQSIKNYYLLYDVMKPVFYHYQRCCVKFDLIKTQIMLLVDEKLNDIICNNNQQKDDYLKRTVSEMTQWKSLCKNTMSDMKLLKTQYDTMNAELIQTKTRYDTMNTELIQMATKDQMELLKTQYNTMNTELIQMKKQVLQLLLHNNPDPQIYNPEPPKANKAVVLQDLKYPCKISVCCGLRTYVDSKINKTYPQHKKISTFHYDAAPAEYFKVNLTKEIKKINMNSNPTTNKITGCYPTWTLDHITQVNCFVDIVASIYNKLP